jgi:predicted DNA-binding protein
MLYTIKLRKEDYEKLDELAKRLGISKSAIIKMLLRSITEIKEEEVDGVKIIVLKAEGRFRKKKMMR